MLTRLCRLSGWTVTVMLAWAGAVQAQGRGGGAWTTTGGDAQRTSSVRTDAKISVESMQKPGFQLLWKRKLEGQAPAAALTQPLLLPNIIAYKGFKALAFVGSSADNVYAIDYELNRIFWTQHLVTASRTAGTPACPGGLTAITRATQAAAPVSGGRGRGIGGGRGTGAPQGPVMPGGRDAGDNVFAISSGGMVHLMNPQVGTDQIPPIRFLPANARVVGSILVGNTLYAATTGNCGGAPNGVWSVDLVGDSKAVATFDTKGPGIVGAVAPTFGTNGTLYVATGSGDAPTANAIVALEAKTLTQTDWFSAASPFTSAPVVFQHNGRELVAAANKDGRLYLLDSAGLGGADHSTPLYRTPPFSSGMGGTIGLATWQDASGTRWVAAAMNGPVPADTQFAMGNGAVTSGAVAAFSLVEKNGTLALQPRWVSRDLIAPVTPVIIDGVVFAVSSGESAGRGQVSAPRPIPAVLYALDGATGKELWTSGNTITSFVHGVGPSGGDSQVYVVTADGTLYAFGMPAER